MTCPDCENGDVLVLRTKGHLLNFRNMSLLEQLKIEQNLLQQMQSILNNPELYYKNAQCSHCQSSNVEYHVNIEKFTKEADDIYADQRILETIVQH